MLFVVVVVVAAIAFCCNKKSQVSATVDRGLQLILS